MTSAKALWSNEASQAWQQSALAAVRDEAQWFFASGIMRRFFCEVTQPSQTSIYATLAKNAVNGGFPKRQAPFKKPISSIPIWSLVFTISIEYMIGGCKGKVMFH